MVACKTCTIQKVHRVVFGCIAWLFCRVFKTIKDALAASSEGDTVLVADGYYFERQWTKQGKGRTRNDDRGGDDVMMMMMMMMVVRGR